MRACASVERVPCVDLRRPRHRITENGSVESATRATPMSHRRDDVETARHRGGPECGCARQGARVTTGGRPPRDGGIFIARPSPTRTTCVMTDECFGPRSIMVQSLWEGFVATHRTLASVRTYSRDIDAALDRGRLGSRVQRRRPLAAGMPKPLGADQGVWFWRRTKRSRVESSPTRGT